MVGQMWLDEGATCGQGLQINWDRLAACGTTLVSSCLMAQIENDVIMPESFLDDMPISREQHSRYSLHHPLTRDPIATTACRPEPTAMCFQ